MSDRSAPARARLALVLLALAAAPLGARIPSFEEVAGHRFGERITVHHEMVAYLERLAATSPRVAVVDQGTSWEGRRLLMAIVTSPANHARLDAIRAAAARLEDPRQLAADELASILDRQPAIVWLGGSIHGFELSGSEGLLKLLAELAGAEDEATVTALDRLVVLIDPMLNPDGRDAFAHHNHQRLGHAPNPDRADWGNDVSRWDALRFRTGHYYFDTNRDWFAHTQAETRARWPTIRAWRPQVMVDAHEMSPDVEFFFDPATEPWGAYFPDYARRWFERFNRAYAAAFDARGFEYMTGERYNYYYPGYTTSWGSYQGAAGMLYEQGSSRGLAITRADDSVRTLADALEQQYAAARAAIDLAAGSRRQLLEDYLEAHRRAIAEGGEGTRRYLIEAGGDPGHRAELAGLLERNGIAVRVLRRDATLERVRDRRGAAAGSRTFAAGTYVVEAAQPRSRLLRVLLEPDLPLPPAFLERARARLDRGEDPRFYDVTAWSLPLLFDLPAYGSADGRPLDLAPLAASPPPAPPQATYAYLIDGRDARAMSVLYHLRQRGHRVAVALVDSRIEGVEVARGTVVARVGQNDASLHQAVRQLAAEHGVAVRAVATGLAAPGLPALGSADVVPVRRVAIALLAEEPVHPYSFGWAWYVLDRQYGLPVTVLRADSLGRTPLAPYQTLVVPDLTDASALAAKLGADGLARLGQWIADGGTLVAIGGAVDFVRQHLGPFALRSFYEPEAESPGDGEKPAEEKAPEIRRFPVPGAVLRAVLDREVWLTAGYDGDELPFLVTSDRVFLAPEGPPDRGRRVALRYASEPPLRLSGHLWPESLERLRGAVLVYDERRGRGRIVAFAEEPNFRAYFRGADRLFLNAVVLGPSAP
ncbi:MAG: hypothetical protein D6696_01295 [Acidobacteria bacterium]|nr:MAG: hypothetical protein D6696_01295 [Acidobacteriota bacterium]